MELLKLQQISRWSRCRRHFLPGSPAASGEAGVCLICDTAETTERLKHTWRHKTGRAVCVCVCGFTSCGLKGHLKDSLELELRLSGGRMCECLQVIKADLRDDDTEAGASQSRRRTKGKSVCLTQRVKMKHERSRVLGWRRGRAMARIKASLLYCERV